MERRQPLGYLPMSEHAPRGVKKDQFKKEASGAVNNPERRRQ